MSHRNHLNGENTELCYMMVTPSLSLMFSKGMCGGCYRLSLPPVGHLMHKVTTSQWIYRLHYQWCISYINWYLNSSRMIHQSCVFFILLLCFITFGSQTPLTLPNNWTYSCKVSRKMNSFDNPFRERNIAWTKNMKQMANTVASSVKPDIAAHTHWVSAVIPKLRLMDSSGNLEDITNLEALGKLSVFFHFMG